MTRVLSRTFIDPFLSITCDVHRDKTRVAARVGGPDPLTPAAKRTASGSSFRARNAEAAPGSAETAVSPKATATGVTLPSTQRERTYLSAGCMRGTSQR